MAVLKSNDSKELIVTCDCGGGFGCDEGVHIKIDDSLGDYSYMTYFNGAFYQEQNGVFDAFKYKIKKIWAIIWNKDFYYSDIVLTKEDFQIFKDWINQYGE